MKKLLCIESLRFDGEKSNSVTEGNIYEIIEDLGTDFKIINDLGEEHYFSKSVNGILNYRNWFKIIDNEPEAIEKAKKYDELQKWFWWLERRTHDGKTAKINIETFLNGIKEYFEPYKGE